MLRGPPLLKRGESNPPLDMLAVSCDRPNELPAVSKLFPDAAGVAKLGWLSTLNISTRNCAEIRSVILVVLSRLTSSCWRPAARRILRPASPYVPAAGRAKAAGFAT